MRELCVTLYLSFMSSLSQIYQKYKGKNTLWDMNKFLKRLALMRGTVTSRVPHFTCNNRNSGSPRGKSNKHDLNFVTPQSFHITQICSRAGAKRFVIVDTPVVMIASCWYDFSCLICSQKLLKNPDSIVDAPSIASLTCLWFRIWGNPDWTKSVHLRVKNDKPLCICM